MHLLQKLRSHYGVSLVRLSSILWDPLTRCAQATWGPMPLVYDTEVIEPRRACGVRVLSSDDTGDDGAFRQNGPTLVDAVRPAICHSSIISMSI
jgi:hypothetical protein